MLMKTTVNSVYNCFCKSAGCSETSSILIGKFLKYHSNMKFKITNVARNGYKSNDPK